MNGFVHTKNRKGIIANSKKKLFYSKLKKYIRIEYMTLYCQQLIIICTKVAIKNNA